MSINACSDARVNSQSRTSISLEIGITDESNSDIVEESEKRRQMPNKMLLYAGLAGITTIAASDNIYQSTKASIARR